MQKHSFSSKLWFVLGAIILAALNYGYLYLNIDIQKWTDDNNYLVLALVSTYAFAKILRRYITKFPGKETLEHIIIIVTICFALLGLLIILTRPFYSRIPVLLSYVFTLGWLLADYYLFEHGNHLKFGLIPVGRAKEVLNIADISATPIAHPEDDIHNYDAIVADFHTDLPDEWDKFITDCHIKHIPVYDFCYINESLTGRVDLKDKSNAHFDIKTISPEYLLFKRAWDVGMVVFTLPVSIPILLMAIIAIRLESKGSPFFTQIRTGKDRKPFKIYKLRSMYTDTSTHDLTVSGDDRITKVGKFIRKTRIDELPQLWNILINDMSLVGPRPEYIKSDNRFRSSISYYDYRYLAKPGITGWAQVNIGHVINEDDTREKLENDIYYVKNISLWLDLHIILKTLKVVQSGYGSK